MAAGAALGGTAGAHQLLQRQRLWPLPPVHPLLHGGATARQRALLSCVLSRPHLAYLNQHSICGRSTLPAVAQLELMAASGSLLSDGLAGATVASAALGGPIAWADHAVLACSIELVDGTAHVSLGRETAAAAQLVRPTMPGGSGGMASSGSSGRANPGLPAVLVLNGQQWTCREQQGGMAAVAAPAADLQAGGYCCHPGIAEGAITLSGLPSTARVLAGCSLYAPTQGNLGGLSGAASNSAAAVSAGGSSATLRLHGMVARSAAAVDARNAAAAPVSPAWQLMWQPVDLQLGSEPHQGCSTVLAISTQPCPLSSLCTGQAGAPNSSKPLVGINAVWRSSSSNAESSRSAPPLPELCFSSEAQLELLLRGTQPQHCLLVQPPGQAVDTPAALTTFRAIARSQTIQRMWLVTYDQQAVGAFSARPQPGAVLLLGETCLPSGEQCMLPHKLCGALPALFCHSCCSPLPQAWHAPCSWSSAPSLARPLICSPAAQPPRQPAWRLRWRPLESLRWHSAAGAPTACAWPRVLCPDHKQATL